MEKGKKTNSSQKEILFVCDDFIIGNMLTNTLGLHNIDVSVTQVTTFRVFSKKIKKAQCIILYYHENQNFNPQEKYVDQASERRTLSGLLEDLTNTLGNLAKFNISVMGRGLNREIITLLVEKGVSRVFSIPDKDQNNFSSLEVCIPHIEQWLNDCYTLHSSNPKQAAISNFLENLENWSCLEKKDKDFLQENVLKILGDCSTYSQLVAKSNLADQKIDKAQVWLERSLIQNPNALEAQNLLAYIHIIEGRFETALKFLKKANLNNTLNPGRFSAMGQCYIALQKYQHASQVLEKALQLDPYNTEARELLGKVKWAQKDYSSACDLFSFVKDPKSLAAYLNRIGIKLVEQKKYQEAIHHYKWAQKVIPSNDQSHLLLFNIGLAHIKAGDQELGKNYFRLALSRKPSYQRAAKLLNRMDPGEQPT